MTGLRPLHPHQLTALDELRVSLATGHRRPMLQLATGAGKTVIAAHIVAGAIAKHKRLTFCVPSIGLVDQTFERFAENGIDPALMGVIQAAHPWRRLHAPIQIATAQTLARRSLPETDLVVIDEAHQRFKIYETWMRSEPNKIFIGLSATPWTSGLGKLYDDLIKPISMASLIEKGYLSPFRVFAPSHPDLAGVKTVAGDYHEGELADRMNRPDLVADIVATWLMRGGNLPTLLFATGRAHAKALHDRFEEAGVAVAYVDANTPREERDAIGRRLAAGEIKIVCNVGCLTTGIDWDVRCLILARPTKSHALFCQIIGRALRTANGKECALILDHSDTHLRLGMVTDIDFDGLDGGRIERAAVRKAREKGPPLPRECVSCGCLVPVHTKQCPSCGHVAAPRVVEESDGELCELGRGQKAKLPSATEAIRALGKETVQAQLRWIQRERGRADGWVANTYRDIFGVWPARRIDAAEEPSPLMRSFVRHKDIRFAKSKAATMGAHHGA